MTSKYEIAANIELSGLEGFNGRMSAKQQREIFGANVFGKKEIAIDATGQGIVTGRFSVCFGTDAVRFTKSFDEISAAVNGGWGLNF